MAKAITSFRGQYRFLSNFYPSKVQYDDILWPTVEHAYQAAKTTDPRERRCIAMYISPADAKRVGRSVTIRPNWDNMRLPIMKTLLLRKFHLPTLAKLLIGTGDAELVEGNTWGDTFWGKYKGEGENHLGRLLMEVRNEIRPKF